MSIFCRMAGIAVSGCALENMIDMTFLACYRGMLSCQFKGGQVVVKRSRRPSIGSVAGTTVGAKPPLVRIFYRVTGIAVFWGALEDVIDMTIRAGNAGVFSIQFKNG
jgi:hypothetical protein